MYGPPFDCKEKAEGEKLRAYLSLLIGRLLSTNIPLLDLFGPFDRSKRARFSPNGLFPNCP